MKKYLNIGLLNFFKALVTQMRHIWVGVLLVVIIYWLNAIGFANPVTLIGVFAFVLWVIDFFERSAVVQESLYDEIKRVIQESGMDGLTIEEIFHRTDIAKDDIKEYVVDMLKTQEVVELNGRLVLKV
jgi:hypothetical protein